MPKRLSDFTADDWKRLRPLTQTLKTWRYRAIDARYRAKPAREGDVSAVRSAIAGRRLLTTIAFGDPQVIEWQLALLRRYVAHDAVLVADNSVDNSAKDIQAIAARGSAHYLRLPVNAQHLSRSHGLALNWVWHNVVRPGAPRAFGFLDHDLFPTMPDDPFAPLDAQPFYGFVRPAPPRWFLWAGFCMFRFDAVRDLPLDFGQDWFIGLDTGGGNWDPLYSRADLGQLQKPLSSETPYREDVPNSESYVQWIGSWLHEVGVAGRPDLKADKRRAIAAMLAPHLSEVKA